MMSRWWGPLLVLFVCLTDQPADAQQFGRIDTPRALCVADPYGTCFHSWSGSPIAYNSYFSMQFGGNYSSGYSGTTTGYFWGGIPAVASATTPEWVVQRTSVFPVGAYFPWAAYRGAETAPWLPNVGIKQTQPISPPAAQQEVDSSLATDRPIRQVSGSLPSQERRGPQILAEGDRLFRAGQNSQAYLRYLEAQRDEGNGGEVYFRQAFSLVAMGRYSHAVAKLKRGLQVDPDYPRHGTTLVEVFGEDHAEQTRKYVQQVARWTNADKRDPDRLFLMGVLMYFQDDPRASEYFDSAWRLTGRGQHLQAFR